MRDVGLIRTIHYPDVVVVVLEGELDLNIRAALITAISRAVADSAGRDLIIDLDATRFIDSAAAGALIDGYDRAQRAGCGYRVVHAHGTVLGALTTMGLVDVFVEEQVSPRFR